LRVVLVSKALVVGAYQRKAEEIAKLGVDLTVLVPTHWQDRRGRQDAEACYIDGYDFKVIPIRFSGNFHLHYYPTLARELRTRQPHILHMDEEPYNVATWLGLRAARSIGAKSTFFTWQNLYRRYPAPFRWIEQQNYKLAPVAIVGNQAAGEVLRRKGYQGQIEPIPQFGVDPALFTPPEQRDGSVLRIGYAGGLLPEKGIDLLLRACANLQGAWTLTLVGEGDQRDALAALATELGIADRVTIGQRLHSNQMAEFYQQLDVCVLPSRTMPNWKEQFGRVLIEAMACEVVVVGSDSGEIPNVIGDAGLIFAEENVGELQTHLQTLLDNSELRRHLAEAGRQRILRTYTMSQIATQSINVYNRVL